MLLWLWCPFIGLKIVCVRGMWSVRVYNIAFIADILILCNHIYIILCLYYTMALIAHQLNTLLWSLQYIRVSDNDSVDACLDMMKTFWRIMDPFPPNLVISVVGGAKNFRLDGEMRDTFSSGLIKVCRFCLTIYFCLEFIPYM